MTPLPLVLGGHSFIQQLGTDPMPSEDEATAIVAGCLDQGIVWFDTTYAPERVALGKALERLGRRDEATVLAWNFFTAFGPGDEVGGAQAYRPEHLERMQRELRTNRIDLLVVHPVPDPEEQRRQEALAIAWQEQGVVGRLGTWMPDPQQNRGPYAVAVAPCNVTTHDASERFAAYKRRGYETLATSPFVRGWELEARAARSGRPIAEVADVLLRYAAFFPGVDRLVVAIRKRAWISSNIASWQRGPLSPEERIT